MANDSNPEIIYSEEAQAEIKKTKRNRSKQIPKNELVTYVIMAVNAIVLILMELNGSSEDAMTLLQFGAVQRDFVLKGSEYYRLFTAMFLHIGVYHLAVNSLSLYIFGTRIEHSLGKINFLIIYVLSGIFGSLAMVLTSASVSAGASGAIFGLTGATLAITQITKKPVEGLNLQSIVVLVAVNIVFGILTPGIGNAAHIGGLAAGYGLGFLIVKIKLAKIRKKHTL